MVVIKDYITEHGNQVSKVAYNDLSELLLLNKECEKTASKKTHYTDLNLYCDKINDFIHKMLTKHKFINGDREANDKNENARFFWLIFGIFGNIHYSEFLKTNVAVHHSSAYERCIAFSAELEKLQTQLKVK